MSTAYQSVLCTAYICQTGDRLIDDYSKTRKLGGQLGSTLVGGIAMNGLIHI